MLSNHMREKQWGQKRKMSEKAIKYVQIELHFTILNKFE